MPTFFRMMEVLSCSMADFLPYLLLVVYPFRNHTRLKSFLAGLLTLAMTPALLYYDILSAFGTSPVDIPFPLMRSIVLLVFAVLVIHANIGKMLLNTLSIINISILISALADLFAADYTVQHLIFTLLLQAMLLAPYALNLIYYLAPRLNDSDSLRWKLLFAAPAVGTVLGCIMLNTGASALPLVMFIAIVLAAAVAALILHSNGTEMIPLLLKKAGFSKKSTPAAANVAVSEPQTDLAQNYLTNLQKRMQDAEHSYKELLLQVMTMEDDLNQENLEQLRQRLNTMRKQLAPEIASTGNTNVDPVLVFYTRQAMLSNVKIATNLSLPETASVSDEDLSILMGCLLECALNTCREQTSGTRRIATASYLDGDLLQIGIKHTYASAVDPDCELLNICREILSRYDGKLTVLDMNGVSQIVAVLHI